MADFSYLGSGKIYLREYGSSAGLMEVGNASALSFKVNEDVKELKDYTQPGGGTYNEVRRIESVEATMTLHDLNAENLSKAVFGTASSISTTPITGEAHTAYVGAFIPTNKPSGTSGAIVVKEGMSTLTANTDYTRVPGGIVIIDGGALDDGDPFTMDYTPLAANAVEALTSSAKEYEIYFAGLNEARSGKPFNVRAWRWKMGAAQSLDLIGDDFAGLEITGKLLKDTTRDGVSLSQYFSTQIVT